MRSVGGAGRSANAAVRHGRTVSVPVHGTVDPAFAPVADVFRGNFWERDELGAAVSVYRDGRPVVDLWAGVADRRTGRPWAERTATVVFSCTKGLVAMCAYALVQDGLLDLDAAVTRYWPEFGRRGKEAILVRWLLTHRAGLPALDRTLTRDEILAWDPVIRAIEDQRPLWKPGTAHAYHPNTYGWLVGEVIRRITGASVGTFFRDRFGRPLQLDTWIGLPVSEAHDVARTEMPVDEDEADPQSADGRDASDVPRRALTMNDVLPFPGADGEVTFNGADVRAAEIPGGNGISTARSLARVYAACVGPVAGRRVLARESLDDALRVQSSGPQRYGPATSTGGLRWGTGFMLASPPIRPMLGPRSFGHDGAGGMLAFGDDEHGIGFAYVTNQMGGTDDDRARRLTAAVRSCLRL